MGRRTPEGCGDDGSAARARRAVARIVDRLVVGDYTTVQDLTRGRRLSADDLAQAVAACDTPLAPLPEGALDHLDVDEIVEAQPPARSVVVDLWTSDGRSDLTLELRVEDRGSNGCAIEVMDLRVL